jgi:IclR family KDG regulon transcriptional repressor
MKREYHSSTIQRALDILNLFKEHKRLSFTDIQEYVGFNKSTLFRVLSTLCDNRYLRRDAQGRYELGLNIFILGRRISGEHQLRNISLPHMKRCSEEMDLTCHLGILDGLRVVIIEKTAPQRNVVMVSRIGGSVPAHCTGQGKTLLAYSPRETVERIVRTNGLERYTPHTITTEDGLFKELQNIRERGYAIDNSEHEKNIHCVAVPILNESGEIEAALSVTGLVFDFQDEETIEKTAGVLKALRDKISEEMGYTTKGS